jgi:regulator of nonsense transcripts 1
VPNEILIRKQQETFDYFENALTDPQTAFMFLTYINQMVLAERLLLDGMESLHSEIKRLVNIEYSKLLNKRDEQRCRILIPKSRILFGICDPWGILKAGQCAVRVTLGGEGAGRPMSLANAEILVGRNPCLHPGDVRKLKAVYHKEFETLRDCIIFPTRGKRPHVDMMSGGDLDGDQCRIILRDLNQRGNC